MLILDAQLTKTICNVLVSIFCFSGGTMIILIFIDSRIKWHDRKPNKNKVNVLIAMIITLFVFVLTIVILAVLGVHTIHELPTTN